MSTALRQVLFNTCNPSYISLELEFAELDRKLCEDYDTEYHNGTGYRYDTPEAHEADVTRYNELKATYGFEGEWERVGK